MEEVDRIILHFLRQLDIHFPNEIKSLSDLQVETIIQAVSKCLITINPSLKVPKTLQPGISHRIEVAAQLATVCKDLGYQNEVGYQTFLYCNESDLRQVFMFLIECLPNEGEQRATSSTLQNKKSILLQNIRTKIADELNRIWIPSCCNVQHAQKDGDLLDIIDCATNGDDSIEIDEVLLLKNLSKVKESKIKQNTQYDHNQKQNSVDMKHAESATLELQLKYGSERSLKELKEEAITLRQKLNVLHNEKNVMDVEFSQILKSCERAETELKNMQNILTNLRSADIPLDGGVEVVLKGIKNNIQLLHTKSDECTSRNLNLKAAIEKHRNDIQSYESERNKCIKTLNVLKETAKSMKSEYANKEHQRDQLQTKFEKINRVSKRSIYTKRILEIISNVDKQKVEIRKILEDTRQIQKEINTLEGQLDRSFSVADETLFKDAKKDDQAKKAYKLLALLHSECNAIVSLVNDTGTVAREIVDLEDHIETEKAKKTEETLKRIQQDLAMMQEEKCQQ